MAEGDRHHVLAVVPLRHWGLESGQEGFVTIGDGQPGTVTQADFDGRLELGHAALVTPDVPVTVTHGTTETGPAEPAKKSRPRRRNSRTTSE